jgi:hypothetical protein
MGRVVPVPPPIRLYDLLRDRLRIATMPIIVADKIGELVDQLPDPPGGTWPADWYGAVAPPFPRFFVEVTTHLSAELGAQYGLGPTTIQRGMIISDCSDPESQRRYMPLPPAELPRDWTWILGIWGFMYEAMRDKLFVSQGPSFVCLDQQGKLLGGTSREQTLFTPPWPHLLGPATVAAPPNTPDHYSEHFTAFLGVEGIGEIVPVVFKAISAMHQKCEAEKVTPPQPNRAERRRGADITYRHSYYVLQVAATSTQKPEDFRRIGKPAKVVEQSAQREHRVRGHFHYYHPDKPMFGRQGPKYVGAVWVPTHKRGKRIYGDIEKDYEID